ncbi:MAG TPA: VWA domain-containing protein [Ghiorsea sp.]|nr:VWA domain-containing protein [Ghiorsea sp.]HIP06476.1 VWA domain-containing protein [Mariprofundaceae bacterium]
MLLGCDNGKELPTTKGVYMLLDTSGTYTQELVKAQHLINFTLAKLSPGDTFAVARVDTASFSEKDIIAKVTFDDRPSIANRQKRQFREKIDAFVKEVKPSGYTDITGGLLQAIEYLNEAGVGKKTALIFSDLKEELKEGYIRDIPLQLGGFSVVALNVTKLRSDNIDPREYMDRLQMWEEKVTSGEGTWRVVNDMERLESIILN